MLVPVLPMISFVVIAFHVLYKVTRYQSFLTPIDGFFLVLNCGKLGGSSNEL